MNKTDRIIRNLETQIRMINNNGTSNLPLSLISEQKGTLNGLMIAIEIVKSTQ